MSLNLATLLRESAWKHDSDSVALIVWEGFYEVARAGFGRVATCRERIVVKQERGRLK